MVARLVRPLSNPRRFVVDADIAWIATDHALVRAALGSGDATTIIELDGIGCVTARGGEAFFGAPGTIFRVRDGVAAPLCEAAQPTAIAATDRWVYWCERGAARVRRVPLAAGPRETIADREPDADGLVVTARDAIWTSDRRIRARAHAGGEIRDLALETSSFPRLAAFGDVVYVADERLGVARVREGGVERLADPIDTPMAIAASDRHVAWVSAPGDDDLGVTVRVLRLDGGALFAPYEAPPRQLVQALAIGETRPAFGGSAIAGEHLLFTDGSTLSALTLP